MKNLFSKSDAMNSLLSLRETIENCDDDLDHIKKSIISIMDLMTHVEINTKNNGIDEELELEIKSFFVESKSTIESLIQMNSCFDNLNNIYKNIEEMCKNKMKEDKIIDKNDNKRYIPF